MEKDVLAYVIEQAHALMDAPTCSREAKAAAQSWLDAIGTEQEAAETKKFLDEMAADIVPIDGLIAFAESEKAAKIVGPDEAKELATHAREIKAAGAKYCDCPACAAAAAILEKKADLL